MYAIIHSVGLDGESARSDNTGGQSRPKDTDVGKNIVIHKEWARVVQDESIACRMYDLPEISVSETSASRLPPIDCSKVKSSTDPWVWPAGNMFVVTSSKGDVVCEFEGETNGATFHSTTYG
jgi:hypothetical protein